VLERLIDLPPNSTTVDLRPTAYVGLTYQRPLTLDTTKAQLLRRTSPGASPMPVPATDWAFADCATTPFPGTPDPAKLCVKGGFDSASEYVVIYTAKDPLVLGIGFAATRDLQSFLRYGERDDAGTPNPLAGKIKWIISRGDSQSGNFIRSYIHLGFNQDEAGHIVWDGANPHIAARQLALNFRFAIGGGYAGLFQPGSEGVLWWGITPTPRASAHRPGFWTAALPRRPVPKSSTLSARSNSGSCASRPTSWVPTPRPTFRCRPTCAAIFSPAPPMGADAEDSKPLRLPRRTVAYFPLTLIPRATR
jgi:hypothetical protein